MNTDDINWTQRERVLVAYLRSAQGGGHDVGPGGKARGGRLFDATLDGVPVEFKAPQVGADSATMRNRAAESVRRGGQARYLVFDLRQSMMAEIEARRGLRRIRGAYSKYFDCVRVVGRTFDIAEEF